MRIVGPILLLVVSLNAPAVQQQSYNCWSEVVFDPEELTNQTLTRCRVAGQIVDYATESQVPLRLFAAVGSATNGTCWYWRSVWTGWEIIVRMADGSAVLGLDPDETPGGPLNVDVTYPMCSSEPNESLPGELLAWDLIKDYVHQVPAPVLNPAVPWGLTGAATHLGLDPPLGFTDSIASPTGGVLEVMGSVAAVTVDWGDGAYVTFGPETYPLLTGYPEGAARHTYEIKTCAEPGSSPRCHPSLSAYPVQVRYQWFAQWRVGGGAWTALAVPDTEATISYPVREIISVLDDRFG